ncbi:hypothetical protein C0J52_14946, partial [Blattella germanica]
LLADACVKSVVWWSLKNTSYIEISDSADFGSKNTMPSKYERKSSQQSWDAEAMMKAILAVRNGEMKFATAARHFSVPRNTLKRRVNNKNIDATENKKVLGKFRCIFNNDQEKEIVDHILEMEKRFYGLSLYDVR